MISAVSHVHMQLSMLSDELHDEGQWSNLYRYSRFTVASKKDTPAAQYWFSSAGVRA